MQGIIEIYCDGGARGNPGPAAAAFVVYSQGREIFKGGKFIGTSTNNKAEYQGVLAAMEWVTKSDVSKVSQIIFYLDSQLIARQLSGVYKIKNKDLLALAERVKVFEKSLSKKIDYKEVPRAKNKTADSLVNQILDSST